MKSELPSSGKVRPAKPSGQLLGAIRRGGAAAIQACEEVIRSNSRDPTREHFLLRVGERRRTPGFAREFAEWLADENKCPHRQIRHYFEEPIASFQASLGKKLNATVLRNVARFEAKHREELIAELAKLEPYDQIDLLNRRIGNKPAEAGTTRPSVISHEDVQALFYDGDKRLCRWEKARDKLIRSTFGLYCARQFAAKTIPGDAFCLQRFAVTLASDNALARAMKASFESDPKRLRRFCTFMLCLQLKNPGRCTPAERRGLYRKARQFLRAQRLAERPSPEIRPAKRLRDPCLAVLRAALQSKHIHACLRSYYLNVMGSVRSHSHQERAFGRPPCVTLPVLDPITATDHMVSGALGRSPFGKATIRLCHFLFADPAAHRGKGLIQRWIEAEQNDSAHQLALLDASMVDWELEQKLSGRTETSILNEQERLAGARDDSPDGVEESFAELQKISPLKAGMLIPFAKEQMKARRVARLKARYKRRRAALLS